MDKHDRRLRAEIYQAVRRTGNLSLALDVMQADAKTRASVQMWRGDDYFESGVLRSRKEAFLRLLREHGMVHKALNAMQTREEEFLEWGRHDLVFTGQWDETVAELTRLNKKALKLKAYKVVDKALEGALKVEANQGEMEIGSKAAIATLKGTKEFDERPAVEVTNDNRKQTANIIVVDSEAEAMLKRIMAGENGNS